MSAIFDKKLETEEEPGKIEDKQKERDSKLSPMVKELLSWVEVIVAAFLISLFLTQVVLINAHVPTGSMMNLIEPGDNLFGFRLAYTFSDPKRFDIVIFQYPVEPETRYIKRIIGLPGETVDIIDGKIYIDGADEPLKEDYLPEEWVSENDGYTFNVPEGCYLCLGDNRNISQDARFWAKIALKEGVAETEEEAEKYTYVTREQILGKALFIYWPLKFKILTDYTE